MGKIVIIACGSVCFCPIPVREECVSDGEDDVSTDALVEEMLQQGDTAVIYPEAPEDEPQRQGTPEASGHDENGTLHNTQFTHLIFVPLIRKTKRAPLIKIILHVKTLSRNTIMYLGALIAQNAIHIFFFLQCEQERYSASLEWSCTKTHTIIST